MPNTPTPQNQTNDTDFMNYLNNYDNSNPIPRNQGMPNTPSQTPSNDTDYLNYPNNNDNGYSNIPTNNYMNNNFSEIQTNPMINNVTPPITSNYNANQYVEDNPNYVDVTKTVTVNNVDDVIDRLKDVINDIKVHSNLKIDTDEINYDDLYQITIKIDKRDY